MLSSLLSGLTVCEGSVKVEVVDFHAVPDWVDESSVFLIVRLRERREEGRKERKEEPS